MSMLTALIIMVITFLSLLGLMDVLILIWVIWRGDKEESELPKWYVKLSKWLKKKWWENMERYQRRQAKKTLLEWNKKGRNL